MRCASIPRAYRSTVLGALEDVENASPRSTTPTGGRGALAAASTAARNASVAADRHRSGLIDFSTVPETERSLLITEDSLASAEGERPPPWCNSTRPWRRLVCGRPYRRKATDTPHEHPPARALPPTRPPRYSTSPRKSAAWRRWPMWLRLRWHWAPARTLMFASGSANKDVRYQTAAVEKGRLVVIWYRQPAPCSRPIRSTSAANCPAPSRTSSS